MWRDALRENPGSTTPEEPRLGLSNLLHLFVRDRPLEISAGDRPSGQEPRRFRDAAGCQLLHLEVNRITNATAPLSTKDLFPESARSRKRLSRADDKVKCEPGLMERSPGRESR